jgi:hypothetical protein
MNSEERLFTKVVMLEEELAQTKKKLIEVERLLIKILEVVKGNSKHDI